MDPNQQINPCHFQNQRFDVKLISKLSGISYRLNTSSNGIARIQQMQGNSEWRFIQNRQCLVSNQVKLQISTQINYAMSENLKQKESQIVKLKDTLKNYEIQRNLQLQKIKQLQYQQKKDNKLHQVVQQQKIIIPDPVSYNSIQFLDKQKLIKYTDCWQISVLRFLHLLFGEEGVINLQKLQVNMILNCKNSKNLVHYFTQNKAYSMKKEYYTTKQGFEVRAKWCQFVNKSKTVKLKIQEKYEVAATVPNVVSFFKGFFPKLNNLCKKTLMPMKYQTLLTQQLFKNYEEVLNQIYLQFDKNYKIHCKIESTVSLNPDPTTTDKPPHMIFFSTVQKIFANGLHIADWQIYQYYDVENGKLIQRVSGHSDYRFPQN